MIKSSAKPQIQKNLLLSDNIYSKCLSLVLNALFWIAKNQWIMSSNDTQKRLNRSESPRIQKYY